MTRPGLTGYSPLRMWMSVPQIVVVVTRMTAWSTPARGFGTDSTRMSPGPWNTVARIVSASRDAVGRVSVRVTVDLPVGQSGGGTGRASCGQPAATTRHPRRLGCVDQGPNVTFDRDPDPPGYGRRRGAIRPAPSCRTALVVGPMEGVSFKEETDRAPMPSRRNVMKVIMVYESHWGKRPRSQGRSPTAWGRKRKSSPRTRRRRPRSSTLT